MGKRGHNEGTIYKREDGRWVASVTLGYEGGKRKRKYFYGDGTPAIRERKHAGDLKLICQMLAGCSTTAAAYMAGVLPAWDDGANFLSWFHDWMQTYLAEKGRTFEVVRAQKQTRLGMVLPDDRLAA